MKFILSDRIVRREAQDALEYFAGKKIYYGGGLEYLSLGTGEPGRYIVSIIINSVSSVRSSNAGNGGNSAGSNNIEGNGNIGNSAYSMGNTGTLAGAFDNGEGRFHVSLLFDRLSGKMTGYGCVCRRYRTGRMACRHIVAAMQAVYSYLGTISLLLTDRGSHVSKSKNIAVVKKFGLEWSDLISEFSNVHENLAVPEFSTEDELKYSAISAYGSASGHAAESPAASAVPSMATSTGFRVLYGTSFSNQLLTPDAAVFFKKYDPVYTRTATSFITDGSGLQEARIIPKLHCAASLNRPTYWLEFLSGAERFYIVRNIFAFIRSIRDHENYELGKDFSYVPGRTAFDALSQKLANLAYSIYLDSVNPYGYYNATLREERILKLKNSSLVAFLDIMHEAGQVFDMVVDAEKYSDIKVIEAETAMCLEFELVFKDGKAVFRVRDEAGDGSGGARGSGKLLPLDSSGKYLFSGQMKCIFNMAGTGLMNDSIADGFSPLAEYFFIKGRNEMEIPGNRLAVFLSRVVPSIPAYVKVDIDKEFDRLFVLEPLKAVVYLDKVLVHRREGISADIRFRYADKEFIAGTTKPIAAGHTDERQVIRDSASEDEIIDIFKESGFLPEPGSATDKAKYCLTGDDHIYDFITGMITRLQQKAELFYSEDFKKLKVYKKSNFYAGIRLTDEGGLLEFSLSHDLLDAAELKHLFESYRHRKKYYRLKDGAFISLEDEQVGLVSELMEKAGISEADFKDGKAELQRSRAMYLDSLINDIKNLNVERSIKFTSLINEINTPGETDHKVPEQLEGVLRGYQKTGFKWLKTLSRYGMGGILADDMGLGKTLQVITLLLHNKDEALKVKELKPEYADSKADDTYKPALVVAPTSLVFNWQEEVKKFTDALSTLVVVGNAADREQILADISGGANKADIVITSYALLRRDIKLYQDISFSFCFIDEAQHIKNHTTQNARAVKKVKADRYFAMTGTPIENSLAELWSVFDFMMPGYLHSYAKFVREYEEPIVKHHDSTALKELARHIRPFILRRMKKDVLKELPKKTESRMICTMEDEQRKTYLAYLMEARGMLDRELSENGIERSRIKILAMITRLRQICCHPALFIENYRGGSGKMEMLFELVGEALEGGHRMLVFSQFTSMLAMIRSEMEKKGISCYYLDGSTAAIERQKMVNSFNSGDTGVFLLSLKAGGTGLNLTGADTVIHYDPWWNPAVEEQATDRAYRIGQNNAVTVYKLVMKDTIEEKIFEIQKRKKELIDSVIEPGGSFLSAMTPEEVRSLFD